MVGGAVIIWACFAAMGPGKLAVVQTRMNSTLYQNILEINVRPSVQQLKLGRNWTMIPRTPANQHLNG